MSWLKEDIAEQWRNEGKRYARDVNAFVRRSMQESNRMNPSWR